MGALSVLTPPSLLNQSAFLFRFPDMTKLLLPTPEEVFDKPQNLRGPHEAIIAAEKERSETGQWAMDVADRECARLLVNTCLYDPPITDLEIQYYANCNHLGFTKAQAELRRLRNDT